MAFGFGKKDKDQPAALQGQQISPEALALLEQMAATAAVAQPQSPSQGQPLQGQPLQGQPQPGMAPQMVQQQQGMSPQSMAPVAQPPMADGMASTTEGVAAEFRAPTMPETPSAPGFAGGKKNKKNKTAPKVKLSREEKKLAAKHAKEEKDRNKRRKKLSKSRFSRARYLREANGNAVAGLALWIFMIIVFIAAPFIVNTQILLQQTRENNDVVNQINQLEDTISRSQPQIELAVRNKSDRENELKSKTGAFASAETVVASFEKFISDLKANNIEFDEATPPAILPQDIGVSGLAGQTLNLVVRADFITYLRIRNKFVSSMRSIRISDEVIQAEPGNPVMSIRVLITIPSKIS